MYVVSRDIIREKKHAEENSSRERGKLPWLVFRIVFRGDASGTALVFPGVVNCADKIGGKWSRNEIKMHG